MVVAQAQTIDLVGDSLVFTFTPAHRGMKAQLEQKRGWIEQVARAVTGRRVTLVTRDGEAASPPPTPADAAARQKADGLKARAKAEPTVQAVLDVFGGEIAEVEEID
jgi:hypothetical protein